MPRYIKKQQHKASCGIVAVINILKWYGYSVSYKEFTEGISKRYLTEGMTDDEVSNLLTCYGVKYKKYNKFTVEKIEGFLNQNKVVLLSYYHYPENEGHFTLITDHTRYIFEANNIRDEHKKKSVIRRFLNRSGKLNNMDIGIWVFKNE